MTTKTNAKTSSPMPQFSNVKPSEIEVHLDRILQSNREKINKLLEQNESPAWENLMEPLENLNENISQFWAPIEHMHAVVSSDELRRAYNACLPKLSEYFTELSHNHRLYKAIQSIAEGLEFQNLKQPQRKVIDNEIRDFKLAGVTLPHKEKEQLATLFKQLSQLSTKFEENVLDATEGWTKQIIDQKELAGLPEHAIAAAKQAAQRQKVEGWLFTLELPSYLAVIHYAESRALREEIYLASNTRASDQGPNAGQWDNTKVMQGILSRRLQAAKQLGFNNYAEYALATRMVKTPTEALHFLHQLVEASLPSAKEEFKILQAFAREKLKITDIKAWDIPFIAEKMRQERYAISQEDLRPYFPEPHVLKGLFTIVNKLFQIRIEPVKNVDVWHPDVRCFAVYDADDQLRSYFYLDLYARKNKRGGAWMDDHRSRRYRQDGELQVPIAFIVCNFNAPVGDDPALFSHLDVITLFHEFGHALQHMLTKINYSEVSGLNGIPWDAVEVASQFLENWAWEKESLNLIAKHYKTEEPLPDSLYEKMQKAKNFHSALHMMRQLEFAIFDMRLHIEFSPAQAQQIQQILDEVRADVSVIPVPTFNRFQHSFSHIFAGGYAAGYYSYKWAEVMASDAFSLFEEKGIFDVETAHLFLTYILEPGGSEDPAVLFKAFRGREPRVDALLEQSGIIRKSQ